jgi:acetate---CoA ligase (ADP-forming)
MPASLKDFQSDVVLRDGRTVTLRAVRLVDADALIALGRLLEPGSLRLHTAQPVGSVEADVAALVQVSDDQVVLIAEAGPDLIGVATYARNTGGGATAEVRFSVQPSWQGRGLATLLLESLARIARARDLQGFEAFIPRQNGAMLPVFVDSGYLVRHADAADVVHVQLQLAPSAAHDARMAARSRTAAAASMRAVFAPRSVAVIGANRERGKIGSEILHNILDGGYTGRLYVVHPTAHEIEGVRAYPTIAAIGAPIDLAVVTVPAAAVLPTVNACIAADVQALVVISAGFGEIGGEGRARESALVDLVRHAGIRMVGPNCMGLINTAADVRLNATFSPVAPPPGRVAMSTQSGALGLAILDYARKLHIGFSTFVSVGNKADVSSNDLIQYWAEDAQTDVIVLYLESFGNPRKFSQIARRVGRTKPIVAVKAGRSAVGARAASSHTGALASSDTIVDALFRQSGVIRTTTIEELFDVATLLANQPVPKSRRVAILTNAGGPGILAADACEAQGLALPPPSDLTVTRLRAFLPPAAALGNPIDMLASAPADHYRQSLEAVLADEEIDSVIVIFIPPMVTKGTDVAEAIRQAAATRPEKPVLAVFISADPAPPMLAPIPSYTFPEAAAVALAHTASYGEWRRAPEGTVRSFPDLDRALVREVIARVLARGGGWATPDESQALLSGAGIPAARGALVESIEAAVAAADRLGYPVVMKAAGPRIVHKTEMKAVHVGLDTADAVRRAWQELDGRLHDVMTGALVQQQVSGGVEMLVGMVEDPTFGPVLACASGGTLTEVLADSQFRLHPITDLDAAAMIDGLRASVLLRGYRGAKPADISALRDALCRLSALVDVAPEIRELDINPLAVLPDGVRALDTRVKVELPQARKVTRQVSY